MKSDKIKVFCRHFWEVGKWLENRVITVCGSTVTDISAGNSGDFSADYVMPGLIDNHIHGGDGFAITEAKDSRELEKWLIRLAEEGVCGIAAAPYGSIENIRKMLAIIAEVMHRQALGEAKGAKILGVHLEGPFLSDKRPGAMQPDMLEVPSAEALDRILEGYDGIVKEMTLAPEREGAKEVINGLKKRGIRILAGHTDCMYDCATEAFSAGVGALTHTFNACRPINHRDPGIIGAALNNGDIYCEAICDLVHLHPEILKLLYRCKGKHRLMVISDGIMTTNLPDGVYTEYGLEVIVKNHTSRLKIDGSLNGGGCYISQSVRNLMSIGFTSEDIPYLTSVSPSEWLGFGDNAIKVGKEAFFSAFNNEFAPIFSVIGKGVYTNSKNNP